MSFSLPAGFARYFPSLFTAFLATATAAQENGAEKIEQIDEIKVIGVTPSQSGGLNADKIAANVQSVTNSALDAQHNLDLSEFLNRNLGSVFINQAQNNPLQPDVQFRGFVASPLLGLPQGISVYQDGVRINEPFGDTVNWALMPQSAIASIDLIPGSNPLFGLNTLGGAMSVHTKTGFSHPGTRADFSAGSFQRVTASIETGGKIDNQFSYFATAEYFEEDGWRDFSPSEAIQLFADLGYAGDKASVDLSLNLVNTDLIGNGPAPVDLLQLDRAAVFTRPDITENDLLMVNLRSQFKISDRLNLDGNLYLRRSDIDTLNGDESEFTECIEPANLGLLCETEDSIEEVLIDLSGSPIIAAASLEGAAVNRSDTLQDIVGGAVQFSHQSASGQRENQFIIGGSFDRGQIEFRSGTELGALDAERFAVPGGVFLGEAVTDLKADVSHFGIYFTDTLSVNDSLAITISGRFNRSTVVLKDQAGTALNGNHDFSRFNPAVGISYRRSPGLGFYAGYSESNRIPTPVELTCADEDDPCRLPNAFLADPPLEQVIAKSWDAGMRGAFQNGDWHLGFFHTINEDDIIFISAGALTNQGFFDNVGKTKRVGIEANLSGEIFQNLEWYVNYTNQRATFEENIALSSANNPAAVNGEVFVQPGDRIPLIPEGLLKIGLTFAATERLTLGADLLRNEKMFFRGDEGNGAEPISGYTVLNLRSDFVINEHASMYVTFTNVLDRNYESFGLFGDPEEVLGDQFSDPRFVGPGAPRAAWAGIRLSW